MSNGYVFAQVDGTTPAPLTENSQDDQSAVAQTTAELSVIQDPEQSSIKSDKSNLNVKFEPIAGTGTPLFDVSTYEEETADDLEEMVEQSKEDCMNVLAAAMKAVRDKGDKLGYDEKGHKEEMEKVYNYAVVGLAEELINATGHKLVFEVERLAALSNPINAFHEMITQVLTTQYVPTSGVSESGYDKTYIELCCSVKAAEEIMEYVQRFKDDMVQQCEDVQDQLS